MEAVQPIIAIGPNSLLMFRFFLSNGDGERVQVTAWNQEARKHRFIIANNVCINFLITQKLINLYLHNNYILISYLISYNISLYCLC